MGVNYGSLIYLIYDFTNGKRTPLRYGFSSAVEHGDFTIETRMKGIQHTRNFHQQDMGIIGEAIYTTADLQEIHARTSAKWECAWRRNSPTRWK